ncbi:acetylglutamate kinase [Nautilia profundicola AmH]|uniref:Acetylglutamate kinase n=1 Tax=Nautilia profundicola (strain ATCC BAA-1463 / DSM 18972 / AmH) TaxID=598659 RepID=ARGB_NAUPA|nr:acetylglutamate kinase [Nautilia profundicola]B9L987.1 RecName: Full=Acetylglutamate kinase; AltName: Full=N-acetyl-L-glutamate 5-phosphotransferase; AltName: Full=NAG kinase; Short=NAGK [Nautilia profundicola AmH]ACM93296.1 acetylglutamate kinase [Nautilia profundicola AmH]
MQKKIETVKTLLDSLPFIRKFYGKTIVIKYGGSAQIDERLKESFAIDILMLYMVGIKPVIVHGGGKRITEILTALNVKTEFKDGVRVTTAESIKIAEMVLSGEINKEIVNMLNQHGAKAIGINGKDMSFMKAKSLVGYTGEITSIDGVFVNKLLSESLIPVIAPIAAGDSATHPGYNINADTAASEIAAAIDAKRVIFLTDTPGVLDKGKNLISSLTKEEIEKLKQDGTIAGGMIPKVDAALRAVERGVEKAHIIDGRIEHSILLELLTSEGIGTEIKES